MSIQLHKAMVSILAMPYFKNEAHKSGKVKFAHEEAVAAKISAAGFTEVQKKLYPKLTKKLLKKWAETGDDTHLRAACVGLKEGSYILQPASSQGFPDILVLDFTNKEDNNKDIPARFVAIECKSTKGTCPKWNDNAPKPNGIYVLASGSLNETTIFMGRDVITPATQKRINKLQEDWKKLTDTCKDELAVMDPLDRGFVADPRISFNQIGGAKKSNYFTHSNRQVCQDNTLSYALE